MKIGSNLKLKLYYIISYFMLFILGSRIPMIADDYNFALSRVDGSKMTSLIDVFNSQVYMYNHWSGRIIVNTITQLFLMSDDLILFRIFFPLIIILITVMMFFLVKKRFPAKSGDITFLVIIMIIVFSANMVVLNQTFFWICAFGIYIVALLFLLLFLVPIFFELTDTEIKDKWFSSKWFLLIIGLVASLTVENYTLLCIGFLLSAILVSSIKAKKIHLPYNFMYLIIGVIIGTTIIFVSPGVWIRYGLGDDITGGLTEKLYFGYTRFIYTYFYLNQKIMCFLSLTLLAYFALLSKLNRRLKSILISSLSFVCIFSFVIGFNIPLIASSDAMLALTDPWVYYKLYKITFIKWSSVYLIEFLLLLWGLFCVDIKKARILMLLTLVASFGSMFCFIPTELGVERASYVSYILIALIALMIFDELLMKIQFQPIILFSVAIIVLSCGYGWLLSKYSQMYDIYQSNVEIIEMAKSTNDKDIKLTEFDYYYIFESELDDTDQDNWVIKAVKRYYDIASSVTLEYEDYYGFNE